MELHPDHHHLDWLHHDQLHHDFTQVTYSPCFLIGELVSGRFHSCIAFFLREYVSTGKLSLMDSESVDCIGLFL